MNGKKNSPIVIGVLSVVLVGLVVRIVITAKTLFGGQAPVAQVAKSAPRPSGDNAPAPSEPAKTPETKNEASQEKLDLEHPIAFGPATEPRDPFYHPKLAEAAAEKVDRNALLMNALAGRGLPMPGASSSQPVSPVVPGVEVRPLKDDFEKRLADALRKQLPAPPGDTKSPMPEIRVVDPTNGWRLVAVLGGSKAAAMLEREGKPPVSVSLGDMIGGLKVSAIRASEVVLSNRDGIWTLPLSTTPLPETGSRENLQRDLRNAAVPAAPERQAGSEKNDGTIRKN